MESYEKKYKNALEWARRVMSGKIGFIRKDVEEVFPELKESDDEKIRKEIISAFKFANHKGVYDKHIAWLEKQAPINEEEDKNMFPTNTSIEDDVRRRSTIQVLGYARGLNTYNQYGKANIDKNIAWLEKQEKQMPTWNEEDEKIALSIEQVMNCASLLNIMPDKVERIRTWLKTLKQRII